MEDFKLIAGIILGGDDRLYTRNDYIQFAYIGGEPPILIPDYHFKVLQANGKLEGFGNDFTIELPDIITIDIPGVEIPQVDVFGPEYFDGPEVQVDVFGPEYLNPDGEDYRYTVYYDPPGDPTGFNTYYLYYDSNGNKLGIGGEERDGVVDLSLQSTIDYINNAFDEWYERNTRTPLLTYKYTVLYDPPSNDTGINIYYQSYDENGNRIGVGGEENSDGYIDLSLESTFDYVNNAFDEWYQANTGEPITDAVEVTGNAATYTFPQDSELFVCYVYLQLSDAPLGSSITANVYNTSLPGSPTILDSILTVPAGQTRSNPVVLSQTQFSNGDVLQVAILSVGSEFPGAGMQLFLGRKYGEGEEIDWERVGLVNTGNGYAVVFKRQDEDKYIIRKNAGQDEVLTFSRQNFLYDSLPPYEYVGNYFWYWRIYGGFYKDIVNGSASGNFSPWLEWAYECAAFVPISLGLPGSIFYPFHDQIKPTFKFMGYIASPLGLGIMVCSPGSSANDSATYSLGNETRPYTATLSGSYSSNANGAHNVSFSHSWQGDSLYAVQWGEKDSPNIEIYTLGGNGSGTASAVQTVDDSGGIGNEFVNSISEASSYTASGEIPENDNLVRKFSYDATHSRSYSGDKNTGLQSISLTQEETGYRKEKTEKQYLLKMNNAAFGVEKISETSYTVSYEGDYSSLFDYQLGQESYSDNVTCTLTERIHNRRTRPLSFVEVKNTKRIVTGSFYISLYNNGVVKSISGYFEDPFLLYKTIVTEREQNITRTRNGSTSNYSRTEVESYQYQSQDLVSSGVMCDIFKKENGVIKQWTSPVTISKSLTTNNDGEDIYSIDSVNFSLSSEYTENEFFPLLGNEGEYIIVPSSSYSEIAYFLIKQFKSSGNLYVITDEQGNETIELAISEQKPSNNNFGGAVLLEGQNVSVRGNNYGADWQGTFPEPSLSSPTQSVWYKWVAPSSTPVTIHTLGSPVAADYQVDTVIAVYIGSSLDSLSLVASNNDASVELPPNGDYLSAVVINPTEGTTYYIQVDGWSDTQWSFVLSITTEGLNVPTPIQEETRRADIYRFDTQTLKWKRMPNAVSAISPLTGASDFISYHATPQTETLDGAICPEE